MDNNKKQILIFLGGFLFFLITLGWTDLSHGAKEIRKSPTARLNKIDSQDLPDRSRVILRTSKPITFQSSTLTEPHRLVIDLTPCLLDKKHSFEIKIPQIDRIKFSQSTKKTVRIVFIFSQPQTFHISPIEGKSSEFLIDFPKIETQISKATPPKGEEGLLPPKDVEDFKKEKALLDAGVRKRQAASQKPRVTFDFYMTNLHNVIRLIADVGGINIIFADEAKEGKEKEGKDKERKVTLSLKEVPWEEALDSILAANNLIKVNKGENIFLITSFENHKKLLEDENKMKQAERIEEVQALAHAEQLQKGEKFTVKEKVFLLKNVDVNSVLKILEDAEYKQHLRGGRTVETAATGTSTSQAGFGVTSGGGAASGGAGASGMGTQSRTTTTIPTLFLLKIPHTNSILARGIQQDISFIEKLINEIDKPISQVMIEARIVEADANYSRELGIRWGGAYSFANATGPYAGTVRGGEAGTPGSNYAVNLPFTTSAAAFGGLGFTFASTNLNIDARIQAMEKEGRGKTISSPKVLTRDNSKAVIKQGQSIPVTTRTENNTFSTIYRDAALTLTVTPNIASDKRIRIKVEITKNEPDFTRVDTLGNPAIKTKEASTEMMVNDGNTVVIGGIIFKKEALSDNKIPGLADIPILGWLFKTRYRSTEDTEMLIFITPKILKSSLSERFSGDTN